MLFCKKLFCFYFFLLFLLFFASNLTLPMFFIAFRMSCSRLRMYFDGFAELKRRGLGRVAAMSAHWLRVSLSGVVPKFILATAFAPYMPLPISMQLR